MGEEPRPGEEGLEPEPELTEEERAHRDVQISIDTAQNESLESTRRMLALAGESKEAGIKTLVFLDEQGEQLERIEEGADKVNKDMKEAVKSLEGMEACCGLCVLPWNKKKKPPGINAFDANWRPPDDGAVTDQPRAQAGGGMGPSGNVISRITEDAREDEMEENMQQVMSMVQNLRNMAVDMGNEAESQVKVLTRINAKTKTNEQTVADANKRANQLLK